MMYCPSQTYRGHLTGWGVTDVAASYFITNILCPFSLFELSEVFWGTSTQNTGISSEQAEGAFRNPFLD